MQKPLAIGVVAGIAAAAMLYSAAQGPTLAGFILSLTSMLPLFLAGLGWGLPAAIIAAVTGGGIFAVTATPLAGLVWILSQAIPVLVLCHYAGLHREIAVPASGGQASAPTAGRASDDLAAQPAANADQTRGPSGGTASPTNTIIEWYPVGRLVAIAGAVGGALAAISLYVLGPDVDGLRAKIKTVLPLYIEKFSQLSKKKFTEAELDQLTEIALFALPVTTAIVCVMLLLFNFWLAARITKASGRLARPWPDIAAMRVPVITAFGLTIALFLSYSGGMPGLVASAFAAALLFVYVCVGLAIIHYVTRGNPSRGFILWAVYMVLILFNSYVLIALAMLGLAEPVSPLRRRFPPSSGPPQAGGGNSGGGGGNATPT